MSGWYSNVIATGIFCSTFLITSSASTDSAHSDFHNDADLARLEHLEYWTGLIEEYEARIGHFPLYDQLESPIGLVRIATADQAQYFTSESPKYIRALDNNANSRFQEFSVSEFVEELESGLGREVYEKYDIQYVPDGSPTWYNYFVNDDGYLMWVTCLSCGVTEISTLLFDGYTPTVNIVSEGMAGQVPKAFTREIMLSHPTYVEWKNRSYIKEGFVREREELHSRDSKEKSY